MPPKYQFRVLFWGIFGALVLRAVFIFAGVALIERFDWSLYVFGAFLLYTAVEDRPPRRGRGPPGRRTSCCGSCARSCRRPPSTTARSCSPSRPASALATPLFAVLVMVETTDVVFAVDSIPAILAVSPRAVHRVHLERLRHPRPAVAVLLPGRHGRTASATSTSGLGVILAFVGVKMLLASRRAVRVATRLPPTWALAGRDRRRADGRHRRLAAGRRTDDGRPDDVADRRSTADSRSQRDTRVGAPPDRCYLPNGGDRRRGHRPGPGGRRHRRRRQRAHAAASRSGRRWSACARSTPRRRRRSRSTPRSASTTASAAKQGRRHHLRPRDRAPRLRRRGRVAGRPGRASRCATPSRARARARKKRQRLVEAMEKAVDWYHERLLTVARRRRGPGLPARRGLRRRDRAPVPARVGARRLGRAVPRPRRCPTTVLADTGLGFLNRSGRQQDFFRGRVLFPIFDAAGRPGRLRRPHPARRRRARSTRTRRRPRSTTRARCSTGSTGPRATSSRPTR